MTTELDYKVSCDCGNTFPVSQGGNPEMTSTGDLIVTCPACRNSADVSNGEMWDQAGEELTRATLALSMREMEEEFYKCSWCGQQEISCMCDLIDPDIEEDWDE